MASTWPSIVDDAGHVKAVAGGKGGDDQLIALAGLAVLAPVGA